jgi:hypothetical protein
MAKEINDKCFLKLVSEGNEAYRCIAHHNVKGTRQRPTLLELEKYFKYVDDQEYGATYLDLAVGCRVRCTHNLATELGKVIVIKIGICI